MKRLITLVLGCALASTTALSAITVWTVCGSGCTSTTVQDALDNHAACGDIIEGAPAYDMGSLVLRNKGCTSNITIRSSYTYALGNPRVSPSDASNMPKVTSTGNNAAVSSECGAGHYILQGLDIGTPTQDVYVIVAILCQQAGTGTDGATSVPLMPHDIVLDQDYIHSQVGNVSLTNSGVTFNVVQGTIRNSWLQSYSNNAESHGVVSWNIRGPLYLENNFIQSSGIGSLMGGVVPSIPGMRVTGYFATSNYYYKPWNWRVTSGTSDPAGACAWDSVSGELFNQTATTHEWNCVAGTWTDQGSGTWAQPATAVKNHDELKNAWGAWHRGNVLSNAWYPTQDGQHGSCWLVNQVDNFPSGGIFAPEAVVAYAKIEENKCLSTPWVLSQGTIGGPYYSPVNNVIFRNNLSVNIGNSAFSNSFGAVPVDRESVLFQTNAFGRLDITNTTSVLGNNTVRGTGMEIDAPNQYEGNFSANIVNWANFGFENTENSCGNLWCAVVSTPASGSGTNTAWDAPSFKFNLNVVVNDQSRTAYANPAPITNVGSQYTACCGDNAGVPPVVCPQCKFPSTWAAVGMVNFQYDGSGDYHLGNSSPYRGTGFNGADPGANIDVVNWATATAVSGTRNLYNNFLIQSLVPTATAATLRYTAPTPETCTTTIADNPSYNTPVFSYTDLGNDTDRTAPVFGLTPNTRYWLKVVCGAAGYQRTTVFITPPYTLPYPGTPPLGANYEWYANNATPCYDNANVAPPGTPTPNILIACMQYGYIISTYDLNRTTIQAQMLAIKQAGASMLRLVIWFTRGSNLTGQNLFGSNLTGAGQCTGSPRVWVLDSTGGNLSTQCRTNLANFLADAKATGFSSVIITMGPISSNFYYGPTPIYGSTTGNWPASWSGVSPYEGYYQEHVQLLTNLHPLFAAVDGGGFQVWVDPMNECVHDVVLQSIPYCTRLWTDYTTAFGKSDTRGFSQLPGQSAANFGVYGGNLPNGIDFHIYPTPMANFQYDLNPADMKVLFKIEYSQARAAGLRGNPIVSETICCSSAITYAIAQAAQEVGANLSGILMWPLRPNGQYYDPPIYFWKE